MKFNHLPVAGGIYDQSPQLMDEWEVIFRLSNEKAMKEQQERDRQSKNGARRK